MIVVTFHVFLFFIMQKTAYELRISYWRSDVCSSDLRQMMPQMIFVNLQVADLDKSKAFYEAVGAVNNPAFTVETAACMVVEEGSIHVMLQIGRASCRERVCQYV